MKAIRNIKWLFLPKTFLMGLLVVGLLFNGAGYAYAYTATEYTTNKDWSVGTIVSLDDKGKLVEGSLNNVNYIGVVSAVRSGNIVEVAHDGTVPVLVSDRDGAIISGTKIGLSSVAGVATAWSDSGATIGVAQETPKSWQNAQLNSSEMIKITSINVQLIAEGANSNATNIFVSSLQKTAASIAGKEVDTWKIITALLIGLGGLLLSFGLLFITSRESFFSMGRNPMAGNIIMRGLWKMVVLAVTIMCISLVSAYLIVRI